jgi:hypothetical protein
MIWEKLFVEYEKFTIDKKLILFQQLYNRLKTEMGSAQNSEEDVKPIFLQLKSREIRETAYYFISQIQEERPFIDEEVSNRIYDTVFYIGQSSNRNRIDLHNKKKLEKYLFIAEEFKLLASDRKAFAPQEDIPDLIGSLDDYDVDRLYEAVCEDLVEDFEYMDVELQEDLQKAMAFAANFYTMHYKNKVSDIIVDSLRKEVENAHLDDLNKKIMSYYSQVSKISNEIDLDDIKNKEGKHKARNPELVRFYKQLLLKNLDDVATKRFQSNAEFMRRFMHVWGWRAEETQVKRLMSGKSSFRAEDLIVMIREMKIPISEIFKDNDGKRKKKKKGKKKN